MPEILTEPHICGCGISFFRIVGDSYQLSYSSTGQIVFPSYVMYQPNVISGRFPVFTIGAL